MGSCCLESLLKDQSYEDMRILQGLAESSMSNSLQPSMSDAFHNNEYGQVPLVVEGNGKKKQSFIIGEQVLSATFEFPNILRESESVLNSVPQEFSVTDRIVVED